MSDAIARLRRDNASLKEAYNVANSENHRLHALIAELQEDLHFDLAADTEDKGTWPDETAADEFHRRYPRISVWITKFLQVEVEK